MSMSLNVLQSNRNRNTPGFTGISSELPEFAEVLKTPVARGMSAHLDMEGLDVVIHNRNKMDIDYTKHNGYPKKRRCIPVTIDKDNADKQPIWFVDKLYRIALFYKPMLAHPNFEEELRGAEAKNNRLKN